MRNFLRNASMASVFCVLGHLQPSFAEETRISFQPPPISQISLSAIVSLDKAGEKKEASMLYPANNAGTLLVGIFAHAMLSKSTQDSEKNKIQKRADMALEEYKPVTNTIRPQQLFQEAVEQLNTQHHLGIELNVPTAPVQVIGLSDQLEFQMTHDQRALIVQTTLKVHTQHSNNAYTLQAISKPLEESKFPAEYWKAEHGSNLKTQLATLVAQVLHMASRMQQLVEKETDIPQKTHRYFEGGKERMQRGQLLAEECDYMTVKNLRGWIIHLPKKETSNDQCKTHL